MSNQEPREESPDEIAEANGSVAEAPPKEAKPEIGERPSRDSLPVVDGVRLVSSARFVADVLSIPAGVGLRDVPGFVEGEVEHLSLLPLEAVGWGYLTERGRGEGRVLAYAALRDQIQSGADETHFSVLPCFSCLCGLKWRRTTWVVLQEPDCLTILRFPARSSIPDYVRSRFIRAETASDETIWALRESLLESVPREDGDREIEGVLRCAGIRVKGRRTIHFTLQRQAEPGKNWRHWGTGRLGPESALLAADIREAAFLEDERQRRHNLRQLRSLLRVAAMLVVLLGAWQVQHIVAEKELAERGELVESRREVVAALEEKEAMIRSTARLSEPPLEAFDWLMAINSIRPDTISFSTTTFARDGQIGVTGEAPSVAAVNQYVQSLRDTGQYSALDVRDMQSTQRGVVFTLGLRVQPGVQLMIQEAATEAEEAQ